MISTAGEILLLFSITSLLVFVVGELISFALKLNHQFSFLYGILGVVTFQAIKVTSGRTIFAILLLMGLMVVFLFRRKYNYNFSFNHQIKKWLVFQLVSLPIIAFFLFVLIDFDKGVFKDQFYDYHFLGAMSRLLSVDGVEHLHHLNDFEQNGLIPRPYRYLELWLTNFGTSVFKVSPTVYLVGIVYPVLTTSFIYYFYLVSRAVFKSTGLSVVLSIGALFVCGYYMFYFYDSILSDGQDFFQNHGVLFRFSFKLISAYILILLSLYFLYLRDTLIFTFCLLTLVVIHPTYIVVASAIIPFVFYWDYKSREQNKLWKYSSSLVVLLFGVLWSAFYYQALTDTSLMLVSSPIKTTIGLKTILRTFAEKLIQLPVYYPIIVVIGTLLVLKRRVKRLGLKLILLSIVVLIPLLFSTINSGKVDYWQFFTNVGIPFLSILTLVVLGFYLMKESKLKQFLIGGGIVVFFFVQFIIYQIDFLENKDLQVRHDHEQEYLQRLMNMNVTNSLVLGDATYNSMLYYYHLTGNAAFFNDSFLWNYGVTVVEGKIVKEKSYPALFKSNKSISDLSAFIRSKNIDCLFVKVGTEIPKEFPIDLFKFVAKDELSGERFYILKQ